MRRYRASLVAATVLLLAAAPPESAADVSATVDDVVGVDDTDSTRRNQPEPTIAINPRNTDVIAAGAQDFRRARELRLDCGGDRWNGFYLSTDGGLTWSNELVPGYCTDDTMGAGSEQEVSDMFGLSTNTDPVMAFDSFGNLFYSHIAFNNDAKRTNPPSLSGSLFVSTYRVSDAGAAVYAKTEAVPSGSGRSADRFLVGPGSSNFDDKQWMTADNSPSSPFYGRIYVTWTKFGAQGGQSSINITHCGGDDAGEPCDGSSWSRGHLVNLPVQGGLVQESFPATAPDGTLYVAFLQFQGGFGSTRPHSGIWVAKSTDGGETFTQTKIASIRQIPAPIPPQGSAANDGLNSFRTGTVPTIGVTADGLVHLAWGQWNGTDADVVYVRSVNGGGTWSPQRGRYLGARRLLQPLDELGRQLRTRPARQRRVVRPERGEPLPGVLPGIHRGLHRPRRGRRSHRHDLDGQPQREFAADTDRVRFLPRQLDQSDHPATARRRGARPGGVR